jgi:hypothetical protein
MLQSIASYVQIDFPIAALFYDILCMLWLERHLHLTGFVCPHCGSTDRRVFRKQQKVDAGPVSVITWWAKDADGEWIVRRVVTNLTASWNQTYRYGSQRIWIETLFHDWRSGGFHLDCCGIPDRERVAWPPLPLAIA